MGFLATLARQIKNKDDDEAVEIIRRKMGPPPARPIVSDPNPHPIVSAMPPLPTRVPMADLGPPPDTPEYAIGEMENLLAQQRQMRPNLSNATIGPNGEILGARYMDRAPALPPPSIRTAPAEGMPPSPVTEPYMAPPMPRVMVGEQYKGMGATEKAATRLRLLQETPAESRVRDTGEAFEVLPPEQMSRKAAAGRGFVSMLPAGAQHGLGGLIGAGLFGLGLGAISPGTVQNVMRRREIAGAQEDYANNLGLDTQSIQNQSRQVANAATLERLTDADQGRQLDLVRENRLEYQQGLSNIDEMLKRQTMLDPKSKEYSDSTTAIQQEAERLSKRTGRKVTVIPGNPKLNLLPRMEVDGQIMQLQHDGNWQAVYGSPKSATDDENADLKLDYEWRVKNQENEAKRTAAQQEAASMIATAEDHQRKVAAIATQLSAVDAQMGQMSPRDPALGPLKRQREQLKQQQATEQRNTDEAYRKAREKEAEVLKYPTMPPPPKRVRRNAATPGTNQGVSLSEAAWKKSHPGGDWGAAQAEAKRRGIPIIQ